MRDEKRILLLCISCLSLILGTLIYFNFRVDTLLMFKWADMLGLDNIIHKMRDFTACHRQNIPPFCIFSLPFALYLISFLLFLNVIWNNNHSKISFILTFSIPTIAIGSELSQLTGFISGQFDIADLAILIVATILGSINMWSFTKQKGIKYENVNKTNILTNFNWSLYRNGIWIIQWRI